MKKLWIVRNKGSKKYSLNRLAEEAENLKIDLTLINPEQATVLVDRTDRKSIIVDGRAMDIPDVVLSRTGSGTSYFNLALLRQFERCDIPVVNSSQSIENVKDKLHSYQILSQNNIPIPKTMLVSHPVNVDLVTKRIGFPCVVKVISGSQGKGVYLSSNPDSFQDLMDLVHSIDESHNILIQEYISSRVGQDLRVFVIGGQCLGAMLRSNSGTGFKANISTGGTGSLFPMTDQIDQLAKQTARVLGLDIAGIDLLFDGDEFKICEANSSPGFEGFEAASGQNVANEILKYCLTRAK